MLQWFELGGAESVALQLAGRQRAAGHRPTALALSNQRGPLAAEFEHRGVQTATVTRWREGYDPTLYPRLLARLVAARADVVHAHDPQSLVYAAAPARIAGAAVIYTKHGVDVDSSRRLWLARGASLFLHAFVGVSERTAETARQHAEAIPRAKVRVIENGVDLSRFLPDPADRAAARSALGIGADDWVVGTVGRIEAVKNHGRLLRAMTPLLSRGARLVIVGDGAERAGLVAAIAALPDEATRGRVHLPGLRRDIPHLLRAFDVFALSSDSEGLPLALLEAMAAGLPVVSTAVGGIPAVVADGRSGLLVAAEDQALGDALERLFGDRELARQLGARGRELVERSHSLDRTAEAYMRLYREFI